MFTPTAAPARALTKSSPYNGPRGQPGPHETNPTAASSRNTGSRTSSRDPTNTSGAAQRASDGREGERGGERQAAPVVATVERRDQYDAQTREGARRHTST